MKHRVNLIIHLISSIILLFGCGGGGGSGGSAGVSTGTVSINITDAKPMLPAGTENVWIKFSEVLVHKSGGSWTSLPLAQAPYTIDLLQFHSGNKTQLVPPTSLETGTYTQIRIFVNSATIRIDDGVSVTDHPATIPSGKLKTDKNFSFVVQGGGAVDITIDFDLSKSIVVTGPAVVPSFKLKPVLHINETKEAATIHGQIANATFVSNNSNKAIVTVIWDKDLSGNLSPSDEVYTSLEVAKGSPANFSIFWLVPLKGYIVEIDMGGTSPPGSEFQDFVQPADLQPGDVFDLNSGVPY
jgi:hypothetical protein